MTMLQLSILGNLGDSGIPIFELNIRTEIANTDKTAQFQGKTESDAAMSSTCLPFNRIRMTVGKCLVIFIYGEN